MLCCNAIVMSVSSLLPSRAASIARRVCLVQLGGLVLLAIRRPRQACFHVLVAVGFVELIPVGSVGREFHRRGRARELFEFGRQQDISNQLCAHYV